MPTLERRDEFSYAKSVKKCVIKSVKLSSKCSGNS